MDPRSTVPHTGCPRRSGPGYAAASSGAAPRPCDDDNEKNLGSANEEDHPCNENIDSKYGFSH